MPPPKTTKMKADEQTVIHLTIDDTRYEVRPTEVSAALANEIRNQCGRSYRSVLLELDEGGDPDIDTVAVLAFIATRQAGDTQTPFKKIAKSISYDSTIETEDATEVVSAGEVPAAD